ncbi:hypothetical protein BRADI_4g03166v3 [Brachypodium distachyon]|uniref:Uncharacterized protein n=1 Tax=Brachypodium distachyon TaxID=15368 RepID=A0A0Q3IIP9_BRADI|nr:hypothetical protein BRADI_4g03166v3 [Brachypodium distachyon]
MAGQHTAALLCSAAEDMEGDAELPRPRRWPCGLLDLARPRTAAIGVIFPVSGPICFLTDSRTSLPEPRALSRRQEPKSHPPVSLAARRAPASDVLRPRCSSRRSPVSPTAAGPRDAPLCDRRPRQPLQRTASPSLVDSGRATSPPPPCAALARRPASLTPSCCVRRPLRSPSSPPSQPVAPSCALLVREEEKRGEKKREGMEGENGWRRERRGESMTGRLEKKIEVR